MGIFLEDCGERLTETPRGEVPGGFLLGVLVRVRTQVRAKGRGCGPRLEHLRSLMQRQYAVGSGGGEGRMSQTGSAASCGAEDSSLHGLGADDTSVRDG